MDSSDSQTPQKLAYSIKEFCAATSLGRTTVYELIAAGQLSSVKVGAKTLVRAEEAKRFLSEL
mgnify:CR=1 FL=1